MRYFLFVSSISSRRSVTAVVVASCGGGASMASGACGGLGVS
jgi:hypothetical protein